MQPLELLKKDQISNNWAHAYLFIGRNKKQENQLINFIVDSKKCLKEDVSEICPENVSGKKGEIKIDDIRVFLHDINLSPIGDCRIAIIRDCQKLNPSSGNILLKSIEEPPKKVTFVLTASSEFILPTIKSRARIIRLNGAIQDNSYEEIILFKSFYEATKYFDQIIKENSVENYLINLEKYARNKLVTEKNIDYIDVIKNIIDARKKISSNASIKLVLENLYLKAERFYKK